MDFVVCKLKLFFKKSVSKLTCVGYFSSKIFNTHTNTMGEKGRAREQTNRSVYSAG